MKKLLFIFCLFQLSAHAQFIKNYETYFLDSCEISRIYVPEEDTHIIYANTSKESGSYTDNMIFRHRLAEYDFEKNPTYWLYPFIVSKYVTLVHGNNDDDTVTYANNIPICPFCKEATTRRFLGGGIVTLSYYPPVYDQNGNNTNPNCATGTYSYHCCECNKDYAVSRNCSGSWYVK